ncbi:MAG: hypothetical protein AAFR44_15510, partial [Pseudomonadota bacterium]
DITLSVDAASQPDDTPFTARAGPAAGIVAMRIMMETMARENLAQAMPNVFVKARQKPVKITDFWRTDRFLSDMAPLRQETREKLGCALADFPS